MAIDKVSANGAPSHSASSTGGQLPIFGHKLLEQFPFAQGYVNLNSGSFGTVPTPVIEACKAIADEIEACPDKFMRLKYSAQLLQCRERIAKLLGTSPKECVFVPNAIHGINTVLRNLAWKKGDVIIKTSITYDAVDKAARFLAEINTDVRLETILINAPYTLDGMFAAFETGLKKVQSSPEYVALTEQGERPKVVVIVDALSSTPGLLMPWERVVEFCKHQENVWSLVDAAHAIGQIVGINLNETKPDFFITDCHKWLYSKRASAVLYVPLRNQHLIKTTLHPSAAYIPPEDYSEDPTLPKPPNFVKQFEWIGTHDPVLYLSTGPALDFRDWLGGEARINSYCRDLAIRGGKRLAEIFGTEDMDQTPTHELTLNMVNVKLPLPATPDRAVKDAIEDFFNKKLLLDWNTYAPAFYHDNSWWVRCCAQVCNEINDFEHLGKAYKDLALQVTESIIDERGKFRHSYAA